MVIQVNYGKTGTTPQLPAEGGLTRSAGPHDRDALHDAIL
ncbi:hypothetical protein MAV101_09965 [Mycobacterium avium subsp. hominissuis 101]|jgi:hypothetical protein|uniref:Uncharacterized protein n=1 Tax=Mycobacterium avium (strain 104) TaxID=243243 RepID=A0A0H2ZVK2_MYCA1|nr:hypothetical protein MAV_1980 [Mycobacterium avium 104]ETB46456.1 hypothetical protein O981_27980 [Mycobacterium avium 10-5560]ETZ45823.1 hypothetical protein L837_2329 [Mycobacterium avium MAV_061107_1842]ETZ51966.1 hypothetical protein L840_5059 [Mycobacterium sp. MAC_011194_8550]ETZ74838.1 hypothetical protein L841_0434 [Mycobacterium sp. MAC_080597_8934]EUA41302.1 hypothetical protein I549_4529 [Mycobacterium avium subsp. avium 2285 (R)]KDP07075.1 hypothetical protein MAV101_09965 [Myc